ncbi:MAG: DNA recombination/repair protein RecA, partial [Lachnospiraceae bacterium]|nr:DNA recombination/repair protein RecA [Lachnospiraceae bacterium]
SYNDEKIGQGRDNTKTYLEEHPAVLAEISNLTRTHFGLPEDTLESVPAAADATGDGAADTEDDTIEIDL